MRGLLADINVQGHLRYLRLVIRECGLEPFLAEAGVVLATFPDVGLGRTTGDRTIWDFCQRDGWVLFTEDRNREGADSLQAVIEDSWAVGCLPVLRLSNKGRFERSPVYARRVAEDVAEILYGAAREGKYRDTPWIPVPLTHPG